MKKLPKEKRDKILIIALGTGVVVMGLWYGLINAQHATLRSISDLKTSQESKVRNAERLVQTVTEIEKRLEVADQQLKDKEALMASGDMYSWIITTMNRFKQGHDIDIPQYSREVSCTVGVLPKFPYRAAAFELRGTAFYHDFGRFVAEFENAYPAMRIQNLQLEPAGATSGEVENPEKLAFRMEIVALVNPNLPQP